MGFIDERGHVACLFTDCNQLECGEKYDPKIFSTRICSRRDTKNSHYCIWLQNNRTLNDVSLNNKSINWNTMLIAWTNVHPLVRLLSSTLFVFVFVKSSSPLLLCNDGTLQHNISNMHGTYYIERWYIVVFVRSYCVQHIIIETFESRKWLPLSIGYLNI